MIPRAELIDRLWLQEEGVFLSREQYVQSLDGWDVSPHEVAGVLVGVTITKGPEFHFATFGAKWRLTRADMRRYLGPLLEKYGHVETKTPKDDYRQQRFNRLIGFTAVGEDEFYTHYKLEHLRHA